MPAVRAEPYEADHMLTDQRPLRISSPLTCSWACIAESVLQENCRDQSLNFRSGEAVEHGSPMGRVVREFLNVCRQKQELSQPPDTPAMSNQRSSCERQEH